MKVTLIMPPYPSRKPKIIEYGHELARPLSLFYLAANLEKHGHEAVIIDFQKGAFGDKDIREKLARNRAPVYGITGLTDMRFEAINIAKIIKELHPESLVIAGGHHFSKCVEDTLTNIPEIAAVCIGDGEETIVEIADAVERNTGLDGIPGVVFMKNGKIIYNEKRKTADLDTLPYYTKFDYGDYPEYLMYYPKRIKALSVLSTRGCPYDCIFCTVGRTAYITRNPKLVADEIEYYKSRFGIEAVNFFDYNLTVKEAYVRDLCDEILRRNLNIKWWCDSRVNIPLDLLELMSRAGCVWISIGVETGSKEMLKNISKRISLEQVEKFIDKCKELRIGITMLIMISHPGETRKDFMETYKFLEKINSKIGILGFGVTMIYPGSEIENIARKNNIIPPDFSWSAPFESHTSRRLLHYPNIPAFIDKLTVGEIEVFRKKLLILSMKKREILRRIINLVLSPSRWDLLNFKKHGERLFILSGGLGKLIKKQ